MSSANSTTRNETDYEAYIQSENWRAKAEAAKQRAGFRCQICNRSADEIDIEAHHRTYERLGHELPEDITVLCEDCHALYSRYAKLAACGRWPGAESGIWEPTPLAEAVKRRLRLTDPDALETILTGFTDLDKLLGGLSPSDLTIVSARPDAGRTAFALSIAWKTASFFKRRVVIFSLQHSLDQTSERLLAMSLSQNVSIAHFGGLGSEDQEHVRSGAAALDRVPILIDDTPALSTRDFRDKCLRLASENAIDLAIIDGLDLMSSGARHGWRPGDEISAICRDLKRIARELRLPILATLGTSAAGQRQDKRLILDDLPEGAALYSDAVLFLYTVPAETPGGPRDIVEVIVAKNHNGPRAALQLLLRYDPLRFEEAERRHVDLRQV